MTHHRPILLDDDETARALRIGVDDLEHLVRTGQLPVVHLAGQRRFVAQEVEALVRTYGVVQGRR